MRLFQTFAYSLTIVLVACLINGVLCGICSAVIAGKVQMLQTALLVVCFSAYFSIPGTIIFWLGFFALVSSGKKESSLFGPILTIAIIIALCTSAFFCYSFRGNLPLPVPPILMATVGATVISMFLHRSSIIALYKPAKKLSHV